MEGSDTKFLLSNIFVISDGLFNILQNKFNIWKILTASTKSMISTILQKIRDEDFDLDWTSNTEFKIKNMNSSHKEVMTVPNGSVFLKKFWTH